MLDTKSMLSNISKGQTATPMRNLISALENEFNKLQNITILEHVDKKKDVVRIFYKSPSMTVKDLYYDIVFEFYTKEDKIKTTTKFKVYCNSPSFYFRYANLFRKFGSLLYTEKYPSMIDVPAEMRNPNQVVLFDKYVYTCLRLSMIDNIDTMIQHMKLKKSPVVKSFNEKRFEYIKKKKIQKADKETKDRSLD